MPRSVASRSASARYPKQMMAGNEMISLCNHQKMRVLLPRHGERKYEFQVTGDWGAPRIDRIDVRLAPRTPYVYCKRWQASVGSMQDAAFRSRYPLWGGIDAGEHQIQVPQRGIARPGTNPEYLLWSWIPRSRLVGSLRDHNLGGVFSSRAWSSRTTFLFRNEHI